MPAAVWEAVKKYFWITHLIFLAVAAYLSANSAAAILHRKLDVVPQVDVTRIAPPTESSARAVAYYQAVLERNLFDSTATPSADAEDDDGEPASIDVQLVGTVSAIPMEASLAILQNKANNEVDVYRVGRHVGNAELIRVGRGYAVLLRNGREERLVLPDQGKAGETKTAQGGPPAGTVAPGIVNKGDNRYEVNQDVINGAMGDMNTLMTDARIVPHMKDGKTDGFKIFNIKSDSLYRKIGLTNGDVIHRVNGMDLTGPEQGLQVFETLRNERNITIDVTRRGTRQTLNYAIR